MRIITYLNMDCLFLCDNWIYSEVGLFRPTSTASHLGELYELLNLHVILNNHNYSMPWAKCFWQNKHKQGLCWSVIYFYRCLFASQTATFQEHDMENVFRMRVGKKAHNCKLPPRELFVLCQEPPVEWRDLTYADIHSSRLNAAALNSGRMWETVL